MAGVPQGPGPVLVADRAADASLVLAVGRRVHLALPDPAALALAELQLAACALPLLESRQVLGLDLLGRRVHLLHALYGGLSEPAQSWWRQHEGLVRAGLLGSGALERALAPLSSALLWVGHSRGRRLGLALRALLARPGDGARMLRKLTTADALRRGLTQEPNPDASWIRHGGWTLDTAPPWLGTGGEAHRLAAANILLTKPDAHVVGAVVGLEGDTLGESLADQVEEGGWLMARAPHPDAEAWHPGAGWSVDESATSQAHALDQTVLFGPLRLYRRATTAPGRAR